MSIELLKLASKRLGNADKVKIQELVGLYHETVYNILAWKEERDIPPRTAGIAHRMLYDFILK